ncbi:GntR family transcriptional regulator [bacterium D16-51]|nr:GntR family transcriptional regulator [bacterium D16-59]RKI62428.1 GntR family transcriptional regulator [bacterium D16-51]
MKIDFNDVVPIYIQIADAIEDDILSGRLEEGGNCYSQIQIAKEVNINPATAAKGIRLLVERGVLKKVRGQAMTISENAAAMIKERKLEQMLSEMLENIIRESKKLGISEEELIERIRQMYQDVTVHG